MFRCTALLPVHGIMIDPESNKISQGHLTMDKSNRVKLIKQLRLAVEAEEFEDADLTLQEFGFEGISQDRFGPPIGYVISQGRDEDLVALAQHYGLLDDHSHVIDSPGPMQPDSTETLSVFASHLSDHRKSVGEVGDALHDYGVDLFVAHDKIAFDDDWEAEILKRLRNSHAGVAFLHAGFKASSWCDQEVGWLLGRRVPVASVMFDRNSPYGPLGKRQSLNGDNFEPLGIASEIVTKFIATKPALEHMLINSLVKGIQSSHSYSNTDQVWAVLRQFANLNKRQCSELVAGLNNSQVASYHSRSWPHSPHDGASPYSIVIPEFLLRQPGCVDDVKAEVDRWVNATK